jgi:hypothetical protein
MGRRRRSSENIGKEKKRKASFSPISLSLSFQTD